MVVIEMASIYQAYKSKKVEAILFYCTEKVGSEFFPFPSHSRAFIFTIKFPVQDKRFKNGGLGKQSNSQCSF